MSGEMALWAARQDIANLAAKMTLIALADSYNDTTGQCFPSHQTLSEFVRRSQTQIKEALRWLEKEGWVKKSARYAANNRQTSNAYEIIFKKGISMPEWLKKRQEIKGGGNPPPSGKPPGDQAEIRPVEGTETRLPLTKQYELKSAGARISNSLKEAEERQPLAEPLPPDKREEAQQTMKDLAASLRMSQASPPRPRRRRA